jgi:Ser/Thr protein kinase RdoA (MazF antagonist)
MENHIKNAINDSIIQKACTLYSITFEQINYHGGFENFVYMFRKKDVDYVLRFVHSDHHTYQDVLAEIEFIDYLSKEGAAVSKVVPSVNDQVVEKVMINDEDYFTVAVFVKGLGKPVKKEVDSPLFWSYFGEQVGTLHRLTKLFNPSHKRFVWYEDTLYNNAANYLVGEHRCVYDALLKKIDEIKAMPRHVDNYGLIHTDLHFGNMVIDEHEKLTFFDFDDSSYKPFIADIAIIIFYVFWCKDVSIEERTNRSIWMMTHFLKGYQKENTLPKKEWTYLNTFLKLREITIYAVIVAEGEGTINSDWGKTFISTYQQRIIEDIPFLDLNRFLDELGV